MCGVREILEVISGFWFAGVRRWWCQVTRMEKKWEVEAAEMWLCENKQKAHWKWSWEAGRENSHITQSTRLTPAGRDGPCTSDRKWCNLTTSAGRKVSTLTAQPMGGCHSSANEKSPDPDLPVSSSGFFLYSSPSQVPKRSSALLFFSGLARGAL